MSRIALTYFAVLLLASACGGSAKGQQPSWRTTTGSTTTATQPEESSEFIELGPQPKPLSHYNNPSRTEPTSSPLSDAIIALFAEGSAAMGKPAPVADGRLDQALTELAQISPMQAALPQALLEFALQRNGLIEPSPHLVVIEGRIDQPGPIIEQLRDEVALILKAGSYERIGVGAARRGEVDVVLVALQESNVRTIPISREISRGGSAAIEGSLSPEFSEPHMFHTDEGGQVHTMAVATIGGSGFRALFSCGAHAGRQQVELTASDESGPTVLANFPVWCGEKAPRSMRVSATSSDPPPKTREEAEQRMLGLVNIDRANHKLPPLQLDRRLTGIARLHSDEMLRTGEVGHISKTTGSAGDRVKAGGVASAVILENIASAYGVAEAQTGLMGSPGHRANVLSTDVTHIGIGITLGRALGGRRELLVTQVFVRIPPRIEAGAVRRQVAAKIHSVKNMNASAELRQVAQVFASELARGVSTNEASKNASRSLDSIARGFARISTLVTTVSSVDAFDPSGSLGSARVSHHGIGIAQGNHPIMGESAIYIVVLLGET